VCCLPGGTEEGHKRSQNIRCPNQDLTRYLPNAHQTSCRLNRLAHYICRRETGRLNYSRSSIEGNELFEPVYA
jgi:hypothetical protein